MNADFLTAIAYSELGSKYCSHAKELWESMHVRWL